MNNLAVYMMSSAVDNRKTLFFPNTPPEEPVPLGGARPNYVLERVALGFLHANTLSIDNYLKTGERVYTFSSGLTSDTILKKLLERNPGKKMNVLDIGTGNGLYVKNLSEMHPTFTVLGVTASDLRGDINVPNHQYLISNAETLLDDGLLRECSFDFIVSSYTFMHFIDPAGSLERLYKLLAPNGVICIDLFAAKGLEGYVEKWICYLHQNGYLVAAEYSKKQINRGECEFLLIQKTHPTLDTALLYEDKKKLNLTGPVTYLIDHDKIPVVQGIVPTIRRSLPYGVFDPITPMDFLSEIKLPPGWKGILEPEMPFVPI